MIGASDVEIAATLGWAKSHSAGSAPMILVAMIETLQDRVSTLRSDLRQEERTREIFAKSDAEQGHKLANIRLLAYERDLRIKALEAEIAEISRDKDKWIEGADEALEAALVAARKARDVNADKFLESEETLAKVDEERMKLRYELEAARFAVREWRDDAGRYMRQRDEEKRKRTDSDRLTILALRGGTIAEAYPEESLP